MKRIHPGPTPIRAALLLVCALALIALPIWAAGAQDIERRPEQRFGVVEAYYRPADAIDLRVGWERMIFEWAKFQVGGPHEYSLSAVPEAWLAEAQQAGREVVGLLKNTPAWASESGMLGARPHGLHLPVDDPNNYWAAFVRQTVQHYGAVWDIHHWIIYNEPDIRPGEFPWYEFDGEVHDYFELLRVAYLAAQSVDPQARIYIAGMQWWGDVQAGRAPYLERLLALAAADPLAGQHDYYFDGVMVHVYFNTENVWNVLSHTRAILERFGQGHKPIWIDETSASPMADPDALLANAPYSITVGQQADFIVQAAALALAAGVERFAVYRLYDDNFQFGSSEPWGLVRPDGSRRPAFAAYQMVINTFGSTITAQRHVSSRSAMVVLEQPGRTAYVLWARQTAPVRFHVLAESTGETALLFGMTGTARSLAADYVPGFPESEPELEGWWFTVETPGAQIDRSGGVMVQGTPAVLVIGGPPRGVWVQVGGTEWELRE